MLFNNNFNIARFKLNGKEGTVFYTWLQNLNVLPIAVEAQIICLLKHFRRKYFGILKIL